MAKKLFRYIGLAILLFLFWSLMPEGSTFKLVMFLCGCELYTRN